MPLRFKKKPPATTSSENLIMLSGISQPSSRLPQAENDNTSGSDNLPANLHGTNDHGEASAANSGPKRSIISDTWTPEALFMVLCLGCMIAIVVVLWKYDGGALPSLPGGITLNAIISALATGAKSSLMAAVASAMDQGKWHWLQTNTRILSDAQLLDDASRGPYGSLALLFGKTIASLPAFGAVITVLALAFEPFVQQVVTIPVRQVSHFSENTTTTQATAFLRLDTTAYTQAINAGIYTDKFDRPPIGCSSGNCTWPDFRSLGWCSKCEDVTAKAEVANCDFSFDAANLDQSQTYDGNCSVAFDQGAAAPLSWNAMYNNRSNEWLLSADTEVIWQIAVDSTLNITSANSTFQGVEHPQVVLGHIVMDFDDDSHPEKGWHLANATQCVLSYCVRDYQVAVNRGVPSTETSAVNFGKPYLNDKGKACWTADPEAIPTMNYSTLTSVSHSASYQFTSTYYDSVDPEHFTFCFDDPEVKVDQGLGNWGPTLAGAIDGRRYTYAPFADTYRDADFFSITDTSTASNFQFVIVTGGLSNVMPKLAASLTNLGHDIVNSTQTIPGSNLTQEAFVQVRWPWILLPVALCVGGIAFLIMTAAFSAKSKVPLWKSSTLAYLFHGLEDADNLAESYSTVSSMESSAKTTTVTLEYSQKTARVNLRSPQSDGS